MIKKLGFATALSALLLSGCGGGGSGGGTNTNTSKLVGSWTDGCYNDNGYSGILTLVFTDTTLEVIDKEYSGTNCDENELNHHKITKYNYTSGAATKYSNGNPATELDMVSTGFILKKGSVNEFPKSGQKFFFMYSLDGDKLYFSQEDDAKEFDGSTAAKRSKEFDAEYLTKQ